MAHVFQLMVELGQDCLILVSIITTLEILNFKEMAIDALTINSPPSTSNKNPENIQNKVITSIN